MDSTQATWFIAPVTGDDSANGETDATPIKTKKKLTALIGTANLPQDVTITQLEDSPLDDSFVFKGSLEDTTLRYKAAVETLQSVVITDVQPWVSGTQRARIQVAGFDWTPYPNARCRVADATVPASVGAFFWADEVDTSDPSKLWITRPAINDVQQVLTIGDTIEIQRLVEVGPVGINYQLDGRARTKQLTVVFEDVQMTGRIYVRGNGTFGDGSKVASSVFARFLNSSITTTQIESDVLSLVNSSLKKTGGGVYVEANYLHMRNSRAAGGTIMRRGLLDAALACQFGERITGLHSSLLSLSNSSYYRPTNAAQGPAVLLEIGSRARFAGQNWGDCARANTYGLQMETGSWAEYTTKPTFKGSMPTEVRIAGVTGTWVANVPTLVAAPHGTAIVQAAA